LEFEVLDVLKCLITSFLGLKMRGWSAGRIIPDMLRPLPTKHRKHALQFMVELARGGDDGKIFILL